MNTEIPGSVLPAFSLDEFLAYSHASYLTYRVTFRLQLYTYPLLFTYCTGYDVSARSS